MMPKNDDKLREAWYDDVEHPDHIEEVQYHETYIARHNLKHAEM